MTSYDRWLSLLQQIKKHKVVSSIIAAAVVLLPLVRMVGTVDDARLLAQGVASVIIFLASGPVQIVLALLIIGGAGYVFQDVWFPAAKNLARHLHPKSRAHTASVERLRLIHDRLLNLSNAWETSYPAGEEPWRIDVSRLYGEAEAIIRVRYSADEAERFRLLQVTDDEIYQRPIHVEDLEQTRREFLLIKKIAFIHKLCSGY